MEKNTVARTSDITCRIGLDDKDVPVKIEWQAEDSNDASNFKECKAMLLSLFDKDYRDTYKIDLWTSELQVGEMDKFMYQTLKGLCDTYHNATKNTELANDFQKFIQYFGEKTELVPKEDA
jgi:gliding motility-associated protein GldC